MSVRHGIASPAQFLAELDSFTALARRRAEGDGEHLRIRRQQFAVQVLRPHALPGKALMPCGKECPPLRRFVVTVILLGLRIAEEPFDPRGAKDPTDDPAV